jgi:hypothetical protein
LTRSDPHFEIGNLKLVTMKGTILLSRKKADEGGGRASEIMSTSREKSSGGEIIRRLKQHENQMWRKSAVKE